MAIYKKFDDMPAEYAATMERSSGESIFFSKEWFENYIRTVLPDKSNVRLFTASADSAERSGIVMPMYDEARSGLLPIRELRGLQNYYASRFEPLVPDQDNVSAQAVRSVVAEISASKPCWDVVDISPYVADSPVVDCLREAFRQHDWAVQTYECFKNLYLENSFDDFAAFLKTRSSRIRKTAANRVRRFDRDPANSFRIITSPDDLESGLRLFSELYEKRWGRTEPYPDFLPGLARVCAERGWLRLGVASVDGQPGAVQLWIVKDGVAYIYKVAYDEQYTKMSVGIVALFKMFENVLDNESVREVDFLTGDDAYKKDWMSHTRQMMGLRAFNKRTVRGISSAFRHIGGRMVKSRFGS